MKCMLTARLPTRRFIDDNLKIPRHGNGEIVYCLNPRNHPRLFNPSVYRRKINKNI